MRKIFITAFFMALICTIHSVAQEQIVQVNNLTELTNELNITRTQSTVIKLSDSFDPVTTLNGAAITWSINHEFDVTLDGNKKEFLVDGDFRHFIVNKSGTGGIVTFKNFIITGRRTLSSQPGGGGITINTNNSGKYKFDEMDMRSIVSPGYQAAIYFVNTPVEVTNSHFENNWMGYGNGSAIRGMGDLVVKDCSFHKNDNTSYGNFSGGAIGFFEYQSTALITNCFFSENTSLLKGGALGITNSKGGSVTINACYFKNNKTTMANPYADGGAVAIYGGGFTLSSFIIENSTFEGNESQDDGGAIFIENQSNSPLTATNKVINCTIFNNTSWDADNFTGKVSNGGTVYESGGGAVHLSIKTIATFENNTIINNKSRLAGGAFGVHSNSKDGSPTLILKNNIILGNSIIETPLRQKTDNLDVMTWDGSQSANGISAASENNIGIDNGNDIPVGETIESVFGISDPAAIVNRSSIYAGNPKGSSSYYSIIPTIPIIPASGLADDKVNTPTQSKDQRGFGRVSPSDIGAIEIVWVKFDAQENGGVLTGPFDNDSYNGQKYYVLDSDDNAPITYVITHNDGSVTAPAAPYRNGDTFVGWNTDKDGNGTSYNANAVIDNVNSNKTLYAIWSGSGSTSYTVFYDGNGATSNNPADEQWVAGTDYTVSSTLPIYSGHVFKGWLSDYDAVVYQPGEIFEMPAEDVHLTAQWQQETNPPKPEPQPALQWSVSTTTNAPESYMDVDNYTTTKVIKGTPVYLQIRPVVPDEILFDQWEIEYTVVPADYYFDGNMPIEATQRYTFNDSQAHIEVGTYLYTVNKLILYRNGQLSQTYNFSLPYVHKIEIPQKSDPNPELIPGISLKEIAPLCFNEKGFRIPYNLLYTDDPIEYRIEFSEEAKTAGFKDVTTFQTLTGNYISVPVSSEVAQGLYEGKVYIRTSGDVLLIESYPFVLNVLGSVKIIREPESVTNSCVEDGFILSVKAEGEQLSYQWYRDGKKIQGANSSVYEGILTPENKGEYYVEVYGVCNFVTSRKVNVTFNSLQVLMKWDDVLYINNTDNKYVSFQWYKDGIAIGKYGTSIYYTDPDGLNGSYYVRAYYANGEFDETCPLTIAQSTRASVLSVYPNPVNSMEMLTVEWGNGIDKTLVGAKIELYNIAGQKVYHTQATDDIIRIPVSVNAGTYILHIRTVEGKVTSKKIIVR